MDMLIGTPANRTENDIDFFNSLDVGELNIFDDVHFLRVYDDVLLQSKHYKTILDIHYKSLKYCSNVVDLGCGTGNLICQLLKDGKNITGVDISHKSLSFLKEKQRGNGNLKLLKGDISQMPEIENNFYDGVSSMIAAHLLDDFDNHLKEAYRILKPNGVFVLTARDCNGRQEKIVEIVRTSLLELGTFKRLQDNFNILCKKLLLTANNRSRSLKSAKEVVECLNNKGFRNIEFHPNDTDGVMYTIKARKGY